MMGFFKNMFGAKEDVTNEEKPGRTFKRILTGEYFSLRNPNASSEMIQEAKQKKIDRIKELGLKPVYLRYIRARSNNGMNGEITAAHVAFQKEAFDDKIKMVHVTEISFIVRREEFDEFEQMASVSLTHDFKDLCNAEKAYKGKERRHTPRSSPFDER